MASSVIYADLTLLKWVSLILHPNPACEFTNYFQVTIREFVRLTFLQLLVHVSCAVSFLLVTLLWLRVQALFALDYLIVEGHARELKTINLARGVQFQFISTKDGSIVDDTHILANLDYLQFKACPGTFRLKI